jgi:hypothetical protein
MGSSRPVSSNASGQNSQATDNSNEPKGAKTPGTYYEFHYGDPGLFLEVYVPRQYEYFLRETLETALKDHKKVRSHFFQDADQEADLRKFLANNRAWEEFNQSRIENLRKVLEGYSVYTGDGVFLNEKKQLVRDATVIFRIMFLAPLDENSQRKPSQVRRFFPTDARFKARQYLRFWTHEPDRFIKASAIEDVCDLHLVEDLNRWLDDIGLFMNGYVLYKLCAEIIRCSERKPYRGGSFNREPEEQIWIGSFRCLAVNRIEKRKKSKK